MAWYPKATIRNIPPGENDPRIIPRMAILHVAAGESFSLYDYFNGPSGGVESHFYVRYDGAVEQYRDTDWQADANVKANDFAVSIETQGLGEGYWTNAQLVAIKELLLWLRSVHPLIVFRVPIAWNGSGVGYHILFMAEWAGGPRSCPGPNRVTQFNGILVPWMYTVDNPEENVVSITAGNEPPPGYSKVVESWFKDGKLVVRTESGVVTPPPVVVPPPVEPPPPVQPPPPTGGTVYQKQMAPGDVWLGLLKFGQPIPDDGTGSDSIRRMQDVLNGISLAPPGNVTIDLEPGKYGPVTDDVVRAWQGQKTVSKIVDPPGQSSIGPAQAALLFAGSGHTLKTGVPGGGTVTPPPPPPPPTTNTSVTTPFPGAKLGTAYGVPGDWQAGYHPGEDYPCPIGTRLWSAWTATVVGIYSGGGWGADYGNHLVMEYRDYQGKTRRRAYCHLSGFLVRLGQTVHPGEYVAISGNTGRTSGPHVHVEDRFDPFRYNNIFVKPAW